MSHILQSAIAAAKKFSGNPNPRPNDFLYQDLGLSGTDFIEFIEHIEQSHNVLLDEISPSDSRVEAKDVTISELTYMIMNKSS
jgi:hypothetical protein